MSNWSTAIDGLVTVLGTAVTGLHAYNHPVDAVHELPAAILLPESMDPRIALGGNSFTGRIRVVFLTMAGHSEESFRQMYDYIDPTTGTRSLIKAVRDARTLDGAVDDADVVSVENIGRRQMSDGFYTGFDLIVEFVKSVA